MKIVACVKVCPEAQDIVVLPDRSLDLARAAWKIGAYDLNAVEAARVLADQVGGEAVGLTLGGEALDSTRLRKDILSRGLDSLVVVPGDPDGDSLQTAGALRAALDQLGAVDLVLLGAGSADLYARQVGNQLGALWGVPTLNAVTSITPQGEGSVVVERVLDDVVQVVDVMLPAVLSVTSGANTPRVPGMRDILAAGKKPVVSLVAAGPPASVRRVGLLAPEQVDRQHTIVDADPAEAVRQLASYLKSL